MNCLENWFCSTRFWRHLTERQLLPWLLSDQELGEHLLEIGAGAGAATSELQKRAARVISLEYNHSLASGIARRQGLTNATIVQGDAARLPFASNIFSAVVAILVLHHLQSCELQNRAFEEIHRVLRPGGCFLALEIQDNWLHRAVHIASTFVPVQPDDIPARLRSRGFSKVTLDFRGGGFGLQASKMDTPS